MLSSPASPTTPPSTERERLLAIVAAAGTSLTVACAAPVASRGGSAADAAFLIALAFLPYAALLRFRLHHDPKRALWLAMPLAGLSGLLLVSAPPVLSDDVYRYLWDARVLASGTDPYAYAPDDPALAALRDAYHPLINHPDLPTIYPPLAQLVFSLANLLGHHPAAFKLVALLAHLATVPLVARLAPPAIASRAVALYALSPLALAETALAGHVDAFAGLALTATALLVGRGALALGALALGAASAIKLVGIPLLPLLVRRPRALVLAGFIGVISLIPLGLSGYASSPRVTSRSGLSAYSTDWQANEGVFVAIAESCRFSFELVGFLTGAPGGWVRLDALAPLVDSVVGTPLDPHSGRRDPKKAIARPYSFETRRLGGMAARALVALFVLGLALRQGRRGTPFAHATRTILLATLLLTPTLHPWYVLWLLPLECALGGASGLVLSAAVLVSYAPFTSADFGLSVGARVVEHGLVLGTLWGEFRLGTGRMADGEKRPA